MSFFADLLGNAALTGEKIVGDKIEQQQRLDLEDRQNALSIARQKAIDENRIALEDRKLQEKQARTSRQMQQVEAGAPEVSRARQMLEAQSRAPSVDGNVLDIIKSKLSPEELKKYYGVKDDAVSRIDDQLTVARKNGLYDAESELKTARTETVNAIREEWKRTYEQGRLENDTTRAEAALNTSEAALNRAEKSGGSGATKLRSTYDSADGKKIGVMSDGSTIVLSESSLTFNDKVSKIITAKEKADRKFRQLPTEEKIRQATAQLQAGGSAPAKAPNAKPTGGYPDGTELNGPGGKKYIVKNGVPVPK